MPPRWPWTFISTWKRNRRTIILITATGRDADRCGQMEDNLVLELYRKVLAENDRPIIPIAIRMDNAIPLGMGCGSSAAGRLAAIAMAVHFGRLGWDGERILSEAAALEGHPDNVAACWLGGFVAAANDGGTIQVARVVPPAEWRAHRGCSIRSAGHQQSARGSAGGVLPV